MQKWAYKVVQGNTDKKELAYELDGYGEDGWELVAVTMAGVVPTLYFKKPEEVFVDKYN